MSILKYNENPTISDTVVFEINTTDVNGCVLQTPYKINSLVFYYAEKSFANGNIKAYEDRIYDLDKLKKAKEAEILACSDPTPENIDNAKRLKNESESNVSVNPFYFNEAKPVHVVGNESYPAWLSTDLENSFLELTDTGTFTYTWQPQGMREGDYFVCWTWTPLAAGDKFSNHIKFSLLGDTQTTTSIPTHFTDPKKYITLLDRYTPEMFKLSICPSDRTPDVLEKLNRSISSGFNILEDLANQIVDLQDANSVHEALIPYLSNMFGLKLKTDDPTKWRGQIKRAVPLAKMKGTKKSLDEAMELAGIKLLNLNQLWQIISSYTWQESFLYDGINSSFTLEKNALPVDSDNFELWIRPIDEDWVQLSSDYVEFSTNEDGQTVMNWIGDTLLVDPIDLVLNDQIKVLYLYRAIPNETVQNLENYIRMLPLMDLRDERLQKYPPKNWNVRVITQNDPLFDLVVPNRHPYHEDLIYGKIRTEFPYSENIYNMDEYNGSIRNSKNPCDIDKEFVDPCSACMSSCYNIDLEIDNLSDDRIFEANQVLKENTPFHAILHTLNFVGGINEFLETPSEEIEVLISYNQEDFVLAGDGQMYFNRIMKDVETKGIHRDELASTEVALATTSGVAYNDEIVMFCPEVKLENLGISTNNTAKMEIKTPHSLAGIYSVVNPKGHTIELSSGSVEPSCDTFFGVDNTLNSCAFVFDINNEVESINGTLCNIEQKNTYLIKKGSQDFGALKVQTSKDVEDGTSSMASEILISAYSGTPYTILDILPDGNLVIENTGTLPANSVSNVDYTISHNSQELVSDTSDLEVVKRGRVTALSSGALPIQNSLKINENYYQKIGSTEYLVTEFEGTDKYFISNYNGGSAAGVTVDMRQKIVKESIGYLSHRGLKLKMSGNIEQSLGIQNGENSYVVVDDGVENNKFKENYIINIDGDNYWIENIDGTTPASHTTITLSGPDNYWKKLSAGGTNVSVTIYRYLKQGATIEGQQFDLPEHTFSVLDRSGSHIITNTSEDGTVTSLNFDEGNAFTENVYQNESISFTIEYKDGITEERQI